MPAGEDAVSIRKPSGFSSSRRASRTSVWSSAIRMRGAAGSTSPIVCKPRGAVPCHFRRRPGRSLPPRARRTGGRCGRRSGVARIVRHHADRGALLVQVAQQVHDRLAVVRVQVAGGLVGEQDRRVPSQPAGHRHALLLTAGELRGVVLHAVRHADLLQRLLHALLALRGAHAAIGQRQLDVLVDRQVADQVEGLEDEADLAVADARALGRLELLDRPAVERVAALGRRVQQAQDREQRGLAAARGPGDRDVLASLDLQMHARRARASRPRPCRRPS